MNIETITDMQSWCRTWPLNGSSSIRAKQKLLRKHEGACKRSWSRIGILKSFTLTIPWNSANPRQFFHNRPRDDTKSASSTNFTKRRVTRSELLRISWNGRCHPRFGSPSSSLSVVCFSFLAEKEREVPPIMCKEAPLSTMHTLSFDFVMFVMFVGFGVLASSIGEKRLENFVLCTAALAPYGVSTLCIVPGVPDCRSYFTQILRRES